MSSSLPLVEYPTIRDNDWLADRLAELWYRHFSDIEQKNEVIIRFGRKSRTRLGSIGMEGWRGQSHRLAYRSSQSVAKDSSVITITGYFADPSIPCYVVNATIAHELVHYAHGFHSPHPQRFPHPHKGGIVTKELELRGLGETLKKQRIWLRNEWQKITGAKRVRRRRVKRLFILPTYRAAKA